MYSVELPGPPTAMQLFYNDGGENGDEVAFCSLPRVVHIKGVPIPIGFVRHERRKDRSGTAHKAGTKLTGEERMVYCSM